MKIGMIGLGRMGANMTRRLIKGGHQVVVHDVTRAAVDAMKGEGQIRPTRSTSWCAASSRRGWRG